MEVNIWREIVLPVVLGVVSSALFALLTKVPTVSKVSIVKKPSTQRDRIIVFIGWVVGVIAISIASIYRLNTGRSATVAIFGLGIYLIAFVIGFIFFPRLNYTIKFYLKRKK